VRRRALASLLFVAACGGAQSPPAEAPTTPAPSASEPSGAATTAKVTCPEGSTWDGHTCIGEVACPAGSHFEKSIGCVAVAPPPPPPAQEPPPDTASPSPVTKPAAPAIPPLPDVPHIPETDPISPLPKGRATFPQLFVPQAGLLRIHYPADLAANPDSDKLTFLEPLATSSFYSKDLVTFTTNTNPVSQDIVEYARVLQGARAKALTSYSLHSFAASACYRNVRGVEARWEFDESGTIMNGRACMFVHHRHGYSFMYAFDPKGHDEARLRAILEAVEITD
jgi:hypothetical protein